jgi:hypothetical protein
MPLPCPGRLLDYEHDDALACIEEVLRLHRVVRPRCAPVFEPARKASVAAVLTRVHDVVVVDLDLLVDDVPRRLPGRRQALERYPRERDRHAA